MATNNWPTPRPASGQRVPVHHPRPGADTTPQDVTLGDLLASSPRWEIRAALAANPACPARLLAYLARDPQEAVRCAVARNPSASLELLAAMAHFASDVSDFDLADDPDLAPVFSWREPMASPVGYAVAANPALPAEILDQFARSDNWQLQLAAAENPNVDRRVFVELARSDSWRVRRQIAANVQLPKRLLQLLSFDMDEGVRRSVARNPSTPLSVKAKLARDRVFVVRIAATGEEAPQHPPSALEAAMAKSLPGGGTLSATVPTVDAPVDTFTTRQSILDFFVSAPSYDIDLNALQVAAATGVDFEMLIGRVDDHLTLSPVSVGVSANMVAARHPLTPESVLSWLLSDGDAQVRRELVVRLAPTCDDPVVFETMARDADAGVRIALAECAPGTMPEALWEDLADDVDDRVASAVAKNPHAPADVRAFLGLRFTAR